MTRCAPLALLIALACSAPTVAQHEGFELVDIAVEGPDGKAVTGLTAQEFELEVAGVRRPVES